MFDQRRRRRGRLGGVSRAEYAEYANRAERHGYRRHGRHNVSNTCTHAHPVLRSDKATRAGWPGAAWATVTLQEYMII
ncbi:hypothetical protein GCM10009681_05720 [Luedemannella helvata]|uniref:Uncharacterized protein n=1 Tax=Luedemannella helvata TaxID=349315 RepID=A0ABN2JTF4_9ACTN